MSSTMGVSDGSHAVGNRYSRPKYSAPAIASPITNKASSVRLNILPLRCCRLALSCAERKALMSGVEGAESIGGVYMGTACGGAAGKVGSNGAADGDGKVGPAPTETVGAALIGALGGGTIGGVGGRAEGGIVVPWFDRES